MAQSLEYLPEDQQAFICKLWRHADANGVVETIHDSFGLREDEFYWITEWVREGRILEILPDAKVAGTVRLLMGGRA